ncbi:MAG: 1-acyl-sn-glycerol-3-phosphate acyltransferase [Alphaproteobacteria bacterium]|nr:1-acyl-sn-glycerol-3-phosphate acyltransferase [Alphaproteobacteria bacterium]
MAGKTLPAASTHAAFLAELEASDDHIVDRLIKERCPSFVDHWSWTMVRPLLYSVLGYDRACRMADYLQTLNGGDSFDHLTQELSVDLTLNAIERMPREGRLVVAANHPTGLADGVAVWDALRRVRRDIVFFANADALRVNPGFSDVLIPVEWVIDKRSPAKTRETLRLAKEAFAEEKCVVIFPSGKLAKKIDGVLTEHEWMPTVVSLARKHKAPVQPLNLQAKNSWLYYLLSNVNGELRDITLFHELLNKRGSPFEMTFGPLIEPERFDGDAAAHTLALREYVATHLTAGHDTEFKSVDD